MNTLMFLEEMWGSLTELRELRIMSKASKTATRAKRRLKKELKKSNKPAVMQVLVHNLGVLAFNVLYKSPKLHILTDADLLI
mmetsp:Transcript_9066/g.8654  ORF Transcript_9066/g.8654 Transcript_9066/m.8654 type:complete len:82 (+) Transcript_9066:5993-6238(+)